MRSHLVAAAAASVVAAALVSAPAQAATDLRVLLTFNQANLDVLGTQQVIPNAGTSDVVALVETRAGGSARIVPDLADGGALRLPQFSWSSTPPQAMVSVTNAGASDALSPGDELFRFGATFRLDAASQGTSDDNGNNLVQRGLFDDASQYKIDVDGRSPACRVKGDAGVLTARVPMQVNDTDWYRATCTRDGSGITLRVVRYDDDESVADTWVRTDEGDTGTVRLPASIPLSVGGKLSAAGDPLGSGDQFNGTIDQVVLRVG